MYPYLPEYYRKKIEKLYGKKDFGIEDRVLFYYSRQNLDRKMEKPLVIDLIGERGDYEEYIYRNPYCEENLKKFKKPNETIEIPFATKPRLFGYLPFGVWIDEYIVYIELEFLKDLTDFEEFLFKLLEAKGTYVVISKPKSLNFELPKVFLYKIEEKKRKIID